MAGGIVKEKIKRVLQKKAALFSLVALLIFQCPIGFLCRF
jgi:hypothetical protein